MDTLTFQGFEWPVNPQQLRHNYIREPIYTKNDLGDAIFSGMGEGKLTISGSGAFFGLAAYDQFRQLIDLFEEGSFGPLHDPTWGDFNVYLTELELTQEPRPDYVAYRFVFTRADDVGAIPK